MSKVTMQDIADSLGISRVSVWKVFNNQSGVSDTLREQVLSRAREMGYQKATFELADVSESRTVSLIVSRPDSSTFWTDIVHNLAQALAKQNISLLYTCVPDKFDNNFFLPTVLTNGTVQGAIILNVYDKNIVKMINALNIPKVFLDTVPQLPIQHLSGDLMLIEGHRTMYDITTSVLQRNIRDISFLGDTQYALTNLERYEGFVHCMNDNHIPVHQASCLTHSIGIYSYQQELTDFMDNLDHIPQAFVCVSDYVAHFLEQYLATHRERFITPPVITGFDGSREYSNIDGRFTTAIVKTDMIGIRLANQIMYRMDYPDAPFESIYINPQIIYRESIFS